MNHSICMAATTFCLLALAPRSLRAETPSLREVADARGLRVGAMILDDGWRTPAQQALVAREFNAATIGTYWTRTHPRRDAWDWQLTDEAVTFAEKHRLAVHLHPVLYPADEKNPAWIRASAAADAHQILTKHVRTAVGRYRGRCAVWDVVNEAVAPDGRGLRDCWWRRGLGDDYIAKAFRLVRAADPAARLIYNEYDCELDEPRQNRRWEAALAIIRDLAERKLVDGFGWQLHTTPDAVLADSFVLEERMKVVADLGLDNFITELDLPIPDGGPESLARQAAAYRRIAEIWLRHRGDGWLQVWGVSDRYSWLDVPGSTAKKRPLLFDESRRPKPGYEALRSALESTPGSPPPAAP